MALYQYTLRAVLETYLHTRRWDRQETAKRYLADALLIEAHALIAGRDKAAADKLTAGLRRAAAALQRPEFELDGPNEPNRGAHGLTPAQRKFSEAGRRAAATDALPAVTGQIVGGSVGDTM